MPTPLSSFNREELISYSKQLVEQAHGRLETDDVDAACWRLADALGALAMAATPGTLGINLYTGLGFRLAQLADEETKNDPVEAPEKAGESDDGTPV